MYSLKPWNTFGIVQYAKNVVYVEDMQQLLDVLKDATQHNQPVLILGEGSNVLFIEDFSGTVIINRIMRISLKEKEDAWCLHVGAGVNWHRLVRFTVDQNMPGLENLALIPGCVGSSPIQNIGAYGVEFKQVCEYVDCIELVTGKLQRMNVKECCFSYRDSIFKHEYQGRAAIVAVGLRLCKMWQPILSHSNLAYLNPKTVTPKKIFNIVCHTRITKLPNPKVYGNAGSFFKNPIISNKVFQKLLMQWPEVPHYRQKDGNVKVAAGWLIDKCQLKGVTQGGVKVYWKQALILVNENNATSEDVIRMAHIVRKRVGEKFNIWLEPEVHFIGNTGEVNAVEIIA